MRGTVPRIWTLVLLELEFGLESHWDSSPSLSLRRSGLESDSSPSSRRDEALGESWVSPGWVLGESWVGPGWVSLCSDRSFSFYIYSFQLSRFFSLIPSYLCQNRIKKSRMWIWKWLWTGKFKKNCFQLCLRRKLVAIYAYYKSKVQLHCNLSRSNWASYVTYIYDGAIYVYIIDR